MRIEPTPVHDAPLAGPQAWRCDSFGPEAWPCTLEPEVLAEIDDAVRRRGAALTPGDLPAFAPTAARLRHELDRGRGFVVIRGLAPGRYSDAAATAVYLAIGGFLGATLPQNVRGERIYSVRDEGQSIERQYGTVGVRFSKTTEPLSFHTDSAPVLMGNTPDYIGLLALRTARSGGASALVSAAWVHNVLREERPDVLARLYQPFHFDRRAELRPGESATLFAPVFTFDRRLAVRYFRFYIPKGHEQAGVPLSPADLEALDCFEAVMNRPELQVHFEMQPGDMQFLNNTVILHSRTRFEDHPEPELRRHLVRLWLKRQEES